MGFFKKNFFLFYFVFPLIFPLNLFLNTGSQWLSSHLDMALRDPSGKSNATLWIYGTLSVLLSVLIPILVSTITLWGIQNKLYLREVRLSAFFKKYSERLCIEILRCWGKSLLWGLFLIIPGLLALYYYNLVPYIVVLSEEYQEGKLDALETSARLIRKKTFPVAMTLFTFNILLPLFTSTVFDEYYNVFKTPWTALCINTFESYSLVFSAHLIYSIFQNEKELGASTMKSPSMIPEGVQLA